MNMYIYIYINIHGYSPIKSSLQCFTALSLLSSISQSSSLPPWHQGNVSKRLDYISGELERPGFHSAGTTARDVETIEPF